MSTKTDLLTRWREHKLNDAILEAFERTPREKFVAPSLRHFAYEDRPLPTLREQSISQPSTVIMMTHALDPKPGERIFEIGTGAGYQAALLSNIVGSQGKVVSVEVIPELVHIAKQNMVDLGYTNVNVHEADGSDGFLSEAPFDKIIITAACPAIPQAVVSQLKEGGIVVAPVGDKKGQVMVKGTKVNGKLELEFLGNFMFVPMKGKAGFKE